MANKGNQVKCVNFFWTKKTTNGNEEATGRNWAVVSFTDIWYY